MNLLIDFLRFGNENLTCTTHSWCTTGAHTAALIRVQAFLKEGIYRPQNFFTSRGCR
jgi:hypothetical protein